MHNDTALASLIHGGDEPLITFRGHTLTINEGHAIVLGLVGLLIGEGGLAVKTISREPQYAIGSFIVAYFVGRWLHGYT